MRCRHSDWVSVGVGGGAVLWCPRCGAVRWFRQSRLVWTYRNGKKGFTQGWTKWRTPELWKVS